MTKDTRAFVPTAILAPSIFRSQVLTTLTRVCICSPCYQHPSPTSASVLADAPLPRGSDATLASGVHCPRVPERFVTSPLCLVGYVRWDERSAPFTRHSSPDLLQPQVQEVVVCNPRRNALLKEGSKSDKVDARKLADLLRTGMLRPVYHGENGLRTLRELARSYQTISKDLTRVMNRLKAVYRGWGIPCAGTQVYAPRYREEWLGKIPQTGVRRRAELLYQQRDGLQALRREVRREFLAESRKHNAAKLLRQIPCIGPVRAARLIGLMQTPHRFRSKRQLWTYSGLGIETHDSAQYRFVSGQVQRSKKPQQVRGLVAQAEDHAIG